MSYRWNIPLVVLLAIISTTSLALAEYTKNDEIPIGNREVPYKISEGNRSEAGVVKYSGFLRKFEQETGRPANLTRIDNRQCRWQITGYMERSVCFSSIMGGQSCNNDLTLSVPISIAGSSNGLASFMDHDPCSDYTGKIASDVESAKNEFISRFTAETNKDLDGTLKDTFRGRGVTVTYE